MNTRKIRIKIRRKAHKKGTSFATAKGIKGEKKPIREHRKITKKRSSIR